LVAITGVTSFTGTLSNAVVIRTFGIFVANGTILKNILGMGEHSSFLNY